MGIIIDSNFWENFSKAAFFQSNKYLITSYQCNKYTKKWEKTALFLTIWKLFYCISVTWLLKNHFFSHKVRSQDSGALVKSTIAVFIFIEICKKKYKINQLIKLYNWFCFLKKIIWNHFWTYLFIFINKIYLFFYYIYMISITKIKSISYAFFSYKPRLIKLYF